MAGVFFPYFFQLRVNGGRHDLGRSVGQALALVCHGHIRENIARFLLGTNFTSHRSFPVDAFDTHGRREKKNRRWTCIELDYYSFLISLAIFSSSEHRALRYLFFISTTSLTLWSLSLPE